MKLLTQWSQWLPNIIFIEIAVIVIAGTLLLSLLTWKWVRRWWKRAPTPDEFHLYHDLPSAEAFLDDWTMTKPAKMESATQNIPPANNDTWIVSRPTPHCEPPRHPEHSRHPERSEGSVRHCEEGRRGSFTAFRTGSAISSEMMPQGVKVQRPNEAFPGEEIDTVLKTIIHVKKDLREKNEEIDHLSKRLGKQQTVNKFAIKEKLLAIRKSELHKRALEQEVRNLELEREKVYSEMKEQEAKNLLEAKEKIELAGRLAAKERVMAERESELELKALESEMRNLEEERDKAYERAKEKELEAFIAAKNKTQNIKRGDLKIGYRINFSRLTSAFSKFRLIFNLDNFKRAPRRERVEKKFEVAFPTVNRHCEEGRSPDEAIPPVEIPSPSARNDVDVIARRPEGPTKQSPSKDGRKTISVTIPPELMS